MSSTETGPVPRLVPPELSFRQRLGTRLTVRTVLVVAVLAVLVTTYDVGPEIWFGDSFAIPLGRMLVAAALGVPVVPFLRRVGYRRRDWLLAVLVPIYAVFLLPKVYYRLLLLPLRDWPPRPDERPRARRVGGGLYVLDPGQPD